VSLVLKLTLAPALVALATVAGRRFGQHVAGLVGSLPVVAAPILLIYAIDHGNTYARHAAGWTLYGVAALAVFCAVYAALAQRVRPVPLTLLCWLVFGACVTLVWVVVPPVALGLPVALIAIAAVSAWLGRPGPAAEQGRERAERLDLALRMVATAALVLTLTSLSGSLGNRLSGLLTPFPIITAVLAGFTHASDGPEGARALLRGFAPGLVSFAAFFFLLSVALGPLPLGLAFAAALLLSLAGHTVLYRTWLAPA
jgi:uncharacterized membrane protein (GlpM family)